MLIIYVDVVEYLNHPLEFYKYVYGYHIAPERFALKNKLINSNSLIYLLSRNKDYKCEKTKPTRPYIVLNCLFMSCLCALHLVDTICVIIDSSVPKNEKPFRLGIYKSQPSNFDFY